VSWQFEVHLGGRGEYEPGESDLFPPLDEPAARMVLARLRNGADGNLLGDPEKDDELQWLGRALSVEMMLLRGPDNLVRIIGFGFRGGGPAPDSFDAEDRALMRIVFELADRLEADVYDQEGERAMRDGY
jgi:hypothetical protein